MERALDSTELQIQEKAQQLLAGLQELAQGSKKQNIPALIQDIELLSLILQDDSQFIARTEDITKLYDEAVKNMELIYIKLEGITKIQ